METLSKLEKYGYAIPPNISSHLQTEVQQILKQIQNQLEQAKDVLWSVLDSDNKISPTDAFHAVSAELSSLMVQTAKFHRAIIQDQNKQPKSSLSDDFIQIKEESVKKEQEILQINRKLNQRVQCLESQNLELEKLNILLRSSQLENDHNKNNESVNISLQRVLLQKQQVENQISSQISSQLFNQTTKSELPLAVTQVLDVLEQEATSGRAEVQQLRKQLSQQEEQLIVVKEIYEKEKALWTKEKAELKCKWQELWKELVDKMSQ